MKLTAYAVGLMASKPNKQRINTLEFAAYLPGRLTLLAFSAVVRLLMLSGLSGLLLKGLAIEGIAC